MKKGREDGRNVDKSDVRKSFCSLSPSPQDSIYCVQSSIIRTGWEWDLMWTSCSCSRSGSVAHN